MFTLMRTCPTIFQSGHTILHSHQQCMSDPVALIRTFLTEQFGSPACYSGFFCLGRLAEVELIDNKVCI